jgi:hypothetical protein
VSGLLAERFFQDLDLRIAGAHPQFTPPDSRERLAIARPFLRAIYERDPEGFERNLIASLRGVGMDELADHLADTFGVEATDA